jgi:hypothetical protein
VATASSPIFLANMVFSQRFRDTADSTTAFGANLLGAMIGGILEYLALIVGYRWLLALVALLYALAFITGRAHLRAAGPALAGIPGTADRARSVTTKP